MGWQTNSRKALTKSVAARKRVRTKNNEPRMERTGLRPSAPAVADQLLMELCNKNSLAEDMAIHCIDDRSPGIRGLLRRALRYIQFRIESIELERVVVIRTRRSARTHVAVSAEADLTAAVRQFALSHAFGKSRGCSGDI